MIPKTARSNLRSIALTCASLAFIGWGCANNGGGSITGTGGSPAQTGGSPGTGGVPAGTGGSPQTTGTGGIEASGTGGFDVGTGGTPISSTGGSVGTGGVGGTAAGTGGIQSGSGGATSTPDAGSTTGPVTIKAGGDSKCPTGTAVICDGFENAAPGATGSDWASATAGVTVNTDMTKVYRGTKSLQITGTASVLITEKKTFTGTTKATNNALWGRVFFLSGVATAAGWPQGHTYFGALTGITNAGDDFHFVGGSRAKLLAQIRLGTPASDRYTDGSGKNATGTEPAFPLAAAGWQCWEWHVQPDDSYDFYINGTEVPEMKLVAGKASYGGMTLTPMPIFGSLSIGWGDFGAGAAVTLWLDEVAIGPDRIGCNN
jgi:hypothetical protein